MKIYDIGGQGIPQRPEAARERRDATEPSPAEHVGADRVEVSETARRMSAMVDAVNRLPEIRQEKVALLRRAVTNGSHHVEPRALARAILEFEDGLFG